MIIVSSFQSEAPLLLTPYLKNLTDSEIHSVMTSGFATVAGKGYILFYSYLLTFDILFENNLNFTNFITILYFLYGW